MITFPTFTGIRCLMMPYIQGDPESVPDEYADYSDIIESVHLQPGEIGYLTIDESRVVKGTPHRGKRAKFGRALHTEAGITPTGVHRWGSPTWGGRANVTLDLSTEILLASNADDTCAVWDAVHPDTSIDGDIGDKAGQYPYRDAVFLKAGEVRRIGILTPHESLPVADDLDRQFLRIVGAGVHGREPYFTVNSLVAA